MGGYGLGRTGGNPTVEDGLTIDLRLMLRRGWAKIGAAGAGTLSWSRKGEPFATISHRYDQTDSGTPHFGAKYLILKLKGETIVF